MGRKSASKSPSKDQNKEQSTDSVKSAVPEPAAPSDLALPGKTSQRRFSLIVWGATGFTGSLVCRQLAETYPGQVQWAIAGRSEEKLMKLKEELVKIDECCKDIPVLTADLGDPKSLDRLVKQSDVLISTAGPFWSIGYPLIEAAVRNSTHYVDIAGEVHFVRKSIRELHDSATARNVKVVHSCGFDSVPSDLGALMLVEHMRTALARNPKRINLLVNDIKGAQSGSSLQSMFESYMLPPEEIELCEDPYCLNPVLTPSPEHSSEGRVEVVVRSPSKEETDQFGMRYNQHLNRWTYPFQFSPVNSRVVRRSAALLGYSPNFKYAEAHEAEGPIDAMLGAFGHTIVHLVATVPLFRSMVSPLLPKPGDGPPEAFRERNHWKFTLYGWTQEQGRERSKQCQAVVSGRRDPGYLETGRMALEAALCLALQGEELKDRGMMQGGVLTPATAMGGVLTKRLRAANIRFEITKTGKEVPASPLDKLKAGPAGAAARTSSGTAQDKGSSPSVSWSSPGQEQVRSSACGVISIDPSRVEPRRRRGFCCEPFQQRAHAGLGHAHPAVLIMARSCGHAAAHLNRVLSNGVESVSALHARSVGVHAVVANHTAKRLQRAAHKACPTRGTFVDAVL